MKVTLVRGRSTDSAVYKVAEALAKRGYEVKLLLWDKQQIWSPEKVRENRERKGYSIEAFQLKAPEDQWAVYFYFPLWLVYQLYFLLKDNPDIYHACDLDTLWPAVAAGALKRKKLCYTIYDFYANNLTENRFKPVVRLGRRFVAWLERAGIRFTDALFLVDECRYDEVKGARIKRLAYIYNSPPDHRFDDGGESRGNNGEITLFYGGLIMKNRGLHYVLKSIEDLDRVKLIIGGTGPDLELLQTMPGGLRDKVSYVGYIPTYELLLDMTRKADVLFRFNSPDVPKSKYESPNKLFEAMMCEKPIILNSEIAACRIVDQEQCGLSVPYGDVAALKQAIARLRDDRDLRKTLGANGRKAYETRYAWKIMEERLISTYENVMGSSGS